MLIAEGESWFTLQDVVLKQREKMSEVKNLIEQMQKMGKAFQQSKIELLNNIRTRLRGWILQVIFPIG